MKIIYKILLVSSLLTTASCVETVVVGSLGGSVLVTREKTISNTGKDISISATLQTDFIKNGLKNPGNSVDPTVNEGRVLLTGIVRDADKANLASDLAWKIKGVREVIDEIQVKNEDLKISDFAKSSVDYALTARVETKLLFTPKIASMNYKVTTVGKTVYLLGVASSDLEIKTVLSEISKIKGVQKVVNHVILRSDKRRSKDI